MSLASLLADGDIEAPHMLAQALCAEFGSFPKLSIHSA